MDTVENQLSVIAKVPGLSNSNPGYEDRIARIERELLKLQSDIRVNENKKTLYLDSEEEAQGRRSTHHSKQNTSNNNNYSNSNGSNRNSNNSSRQSLGAYPNQNNEHSNRSSNDNGGTNSFPGTPPNANHDKYNSTNSLISQTIQ